MDNFLNWLGEFYIKVIDVKTKKVKYITKITNLIMNDILDEMIETLLGNSTDLELEYVAVGDDNTTPTATDTQLGNETFRTPFLDKERTATGVVTSLTIINATEAVGTIEELGIFIGTTATSTENTGKLLSRVLWSYEKTDSEEIQITRVDTLARA